MYSLVSGCRPMLLMSEYIWSKERPSVISNCSSPISEPSFSKWPPMPTQTLGRDFRSGNLHDGVTIAGAFAARYDDAGIGHEQAVGTDNLRQFPFVYVLRVDLIVVDNRHRRGQDREISACGYLRCMSHACMPVAKASF